MADTDAPLSIDAFDAETRARLLQLAASRSQPAMQVVGAAVLHYLDWLDRLPAGDRAALEAIADYEATGLHATDVEAGNWLKELEAGRDVEPPQCHR
jgi:predicted transcriptional regulator